MLSYNGFKIFEYSNKIKDQLAAKFKAENPELSDDQINYYINKFEIKKASPKIKEKDITKYTFKELERVIDSNFSTIKSAITSEPFEDDAIYNENGLTIYEGDTREKCIKYGQGESWCISRKDTSNMFNTYRYRYDEINFYFIFDSERVDTFSKIVLLVDKNGDYYLANRNNSGDFAGNKEYKWNDIVDIQPKLKDLKNLFKPKPLTKREREIYELIKIRIKDDLFGKFNSYDIVESYISFGHVLFAEQFVALPTELRNKYINLGHTLNQSIFEQLSQKEIHLYFSILMKNNDDDIELLDITKLPENIKFPNVVRSLYIPELLEFPTNITLPTIVDGYLSFRKLQKIDKNVKFPNRVYSGLMLNSVVSIPSGFEFPTEIGGGLYLNNLRELPENTKLPVKINGGHGLVLSSLVKFSPNVKMPDVIEYGVYFNDLQKLPPNFKFPAKLMKNLDLTDLKTLPDDVKLPEYIGGDLDLCSITEIPESVELPAYIGGDLQLNTMMHLPENKIPKKVGGKIVIKK